MLRDLFFTLNLGSSLLSGLMATASALQFLAPNTQSSRRPLQVNRQAATGLAEIMGTNLGPKGRMKMLVGGAGQIKLTKDGQVLVSEMAIQHPTAMMIARAATAQDDITGDGTTSVTVLIAEILKLAEGNTTVHPRVIVDGLLIGKKAALEHLQTLTIPTAPTDRATLQAVALTALTTKVPAALAGPLSGYLVDALEIIGRAPGATPKTLDLHMVEIMHMKHKLGSETQLIKGIVMDHGGRHRGMPQKLTDCFVLTCNVSFEYEKSELAGTLVYDNAQRKAQMAKSERKWVEDRVAKIIELKRKVCGPGPQTAEDGTSNGRPGFLLITQKGIDLPSLEAFAAEGILALRRAKRRNMERLALACGGNSLFDLEGMTESDLGKADKVWSHQLGEEVYTFVEGTAAAPASCTLLIKGAYDHTIAQIKDAVRDGLRATYNVFKDDCVVPGAGAVEVSLHRHLLQEAMKVEGKAKIGVRLLGDALLELPKLLARNAGLDADDAVMGVMDSQLKGLSVFVVVPDSVVVVPYWLAYGCVR